MKIEQVVNGWIIYGEGNEPGYRFKILGVFNGLDDMCEFIKNYYVNTVDKEGE